jgi:hypothetical protein
MAKVQGPLYSMSASGKIGDAIVFFGWKGLNVVREWLTPTNKMSAAQGNQRTILGGTGRAVGEILPSPGSSTVSAIAQQLIDLALVPGGQTKQSFLVKYVIDHYLNTTANYLVYLSECTNHSAYASFGALASTLGIVDFSLSYDTIATYDKALGLYLIAKSAIALGFTGTPYTLALASWAAASVTLFGSGFTNA